MIFRDTLTRRLMISILAAMVAGAVLDILLSLAIGQWSEPPFSRSGLLQAAAEVTRILEAAPAATRPAIARQASSADFRVLVHDRAPFTSAVQGRLGHLPPDALDSLAVPSLRLPAAQVLVARPSDRRLFDFGAVSAPGAYMLFVPLSSGEWVEFLVPRRTWGPASGSNGPPSWPCCWRARPSSRRFRYPTTCAHPSPACVWGAR